MLLDEPLIFERGSPGRPGWQRSPVDDALPTSAARSCGARTTSTGLPEVSEPEVLRHFLRLSQWNYSAATTFYPLGSCTMKYNPRGERGGGAPARLRRSCIRSCRRRWRRARSS